ncbi:related to pheromone processing carboxypeptidase (Sxa2) [Phialocephala subalpina]|uniref:Carboxypeptidase n=1 Tax=Phialocephala subalpina TaxID=576137 RepID=A0A1L7WRY3_9HELO|nr:related to pheromone processing carboxypeptidase (Sxa2) [Phialocephala subalpina]
MGPSILKSLLFVSYVSFVVSVFSERYGHKIHGKDCVGLENNVKDIQEPCPVEDRSTKGFRFLNYTTKPSRVSSLPDVDFDVGEMYSGLIPINMSDPSRALFFVYQPTVGAPVDEITVRMPSPNTRNLLIKKDLAQWRTCSLEGFFQENGRFLWSAGAFAPTHNPYSWVNLTNVLWVDQPVGAGFSTGQVTATSDEEIAQDFINFFLNFQKIFSIKKFKIFVTGESYAGRYVPYISSAMIDRHDMDYFNLQGVMTYDPTVGSFDYVQEMAVAAPFIHANNAILNLNSSFLAELDVIDQACGYADFRNKYLSFPPSGHQPTKYLDYAADIECDTFDFAVTAALAFNPCFNPYHVPDTCPMLPSVLGFSGILEVTTPGLLIYFDRADVKKAMHAPPNVNWVMCSSTPVLLAPYDQGPEQNPGGDSSADPIQHALPKVIEHTNRTLISNAQWDMVIITNGTLLAIQNMTWNGKLGFQTRPTTPIVINLPDLQYETAFVANGFGGLDDPQGLMGAQHFERGLMWVESFASGHEQPGYQPRSSYRHLQWLLGHIETL